MTAPTRIKLSRQKGWRMPPDTVKVDRSTRWGNPWKVGAPGRVLWLSGGHRLDSTCPVPISAEQAVDAFTCWLIGYAIGPDLRPTRLNRDGNRAFWDHLSARRQTIFSHLWMLRGKDFACWCKPGAPCHADVLLALANADPRDMTQTLQRMRRNA